MQYQRLNYGIKGFSLLWKYAIKYGMNTKQEKIAKERLKILTFWESHGLEATIDAFAYSRRSLYNFKKSYKEQGLQGLFPKSKAPKTKRSRNWSKATMKQIRSYRDIWSNLGKEQIYILLKPWCEQNNLPCPSVSTIGRIIADAPDKMRFTPFRITRTGKMKPYRRQKVTRRPKAYKASTAGELVGLDAIERRLGSVKRYLLSFVDEASGYAIALAVPSLNSKYATHFMQCCQKIAPFKIKKSITDNGSEFNAGFAKYLKQNNIISYKTYPRSPKMNAKCERFNRTIQEQFVDTYEDLLFEDIELFNQKLAEWLFLFNTWRPHKGYGLKTPVQVIMKQLNEKNLCNLGWTHTPAIISVLILLEFLLMANLLSNIFVKIIILIFC